MQPAVSIVIPVYNAADMLEDTIESLLRQTIQEIEILLVDDCSTDNSSEIIRRYMQKDSRVRGIFQEKNVGVGKTRNRGISEAKGEYIGFVDSDDWVEKNMYEEMYKLAKAKAVDICVCGYMQDILTSTKEIKTSIEVLPTVGSYFEKTEICRAAVDLDEEKNFAYIWNKIYKAKMIKNGKVMFNEQNFGEDFIFNINAFKLANSMCVINETFYHYLEFNRDSLCQKIIPNFFNIIEDRYARMKTMCEELDCFDGKTRSGVYAMHIKHIMASFMRDCDPQMKLNRKLRRKRIEKVFENEELGQICKFAKGESKSQKVLNLVFKSRNVVICQMFIEIAWFAKKRMGKLFNQMK